MNVVSFPLLQEPGAVILNVDDRDTDRRTKTRALENAGFRVLEAATGTAALQQLAKNSPGLVVLDMNLSDMNGLEVCRRIKENPATASTLILQTSTVFHDAHGQSPSLGPRLKQGLLNQRLLTQRLEGEADNYLAGPVEPLELIANVRALLRLRDAQRDLHESEMRFRVMIENVCGVFWILEAESPRVLYVSPTYEEIWGRSSEPLFGNVYAWQESIHPADRERVSNAFSQLLNNGDYDQEYRLMMPDGRERWIHDRGFPVDPSDNGGDKKGRIARISQDISAVKFAEHALHDAALRKDEFLATLAHELRNPLAPMRTAVDLMRMNSAVDDINGSAREIISRKIDHLVRLVDDLLDVSRITQGKLLLQKDFIELNTMVDGAIELNANFMAARGHRLHRNLPSTPIWLKADGVRMTQVIGNLLHNAAKYTPERGEIALSATVDGNRLRIDVTDNGIGISADHLGDIFNMFTHAQRLKNKAPEGLGVGLSLVRHLVHLHGGTIEAHSRGVGFGSTFSVNLPLAVNLSIVAPQADDKLSQILNGPKILKRIGSLRILLVDDSVDAVGLLKILLERLGHTVAIAHEGISAIALAQQFQPQVILLDIGLPELDGYQVALRMRAMPELQHTPLVALTGYGQDRDRERAFASGFDYHLIKPLDMDMLSDLLRRVMPDVVPRTLDL